MTAGSLASWRASRSFPWHGAASGNSAAIAHVQLPYIVVRRIGRKESADDLCSRSLLPALLLPSQPAAGTQPPIRTYTDDAEVRESGHERPRREDGRNAPDRAVRINPGDIEVRGAGRQRRRLPACWTVNRVDLQLFNLHMVTGPRAADNFSVVDDEAGAFFRLERDWRSTSTTPRSRPRSTAKLEDTRPSPRSKSRGRSRSCPSRPMAKFAGRSR